MPKKEKGMNKTRTGRLWSAFVCAGLLFGVVRTIGSVDVDGAMIQIPVEHAEVLLNALEYALETRAPRPGINPTNPALPAPGFDSEELESIAECVCLIKRQVISCCSVIDSISSRIDIIITSTTGGGGGSCDITPIITQLDACCSVIERIDSIVDGLVTGTSSCDLGPVTSQVDACCSIIENQIGDLGGSGSCFPVIATQADIDNANIDVIRWLKTLMYELRGVC